MNRLSSTDKDKENIIETGNRNRIDSLTQSILDMNHINTKTDELNLDLDNEIARSQNGIEYENKEIQINWNEFIPIELFEAKVNHLDEGKEKRFLK